jgi:Ras-related protein Rab-6A
MESSRKIKVALIGDEATGKSAVITRYINDTFDPSYASTIGIDFSSKTVVHEANTYRLQLWDTSGQERFRSLIPSYLRDSAVVLILFDITRQVTFESLDNWVQQVRETSGEEPTLFVVGNKAESEELRQVSMDAARAFCDKHKAYYIEVSAQTGLNISTLFTTIIQKLSLTPPS